MTRMSRAVVMPGDGTWQLREMPVPDPPPGGAVLRELTGDGVHVVIDAASASTATVTQGMQMARRGGTVVIGGPKDRKPVEGFISDWIPMRQLHLHAGFPGDHVKTAVELIRQGQVPTAELLGEVVTVDGFGDALKLLARELPGRDAIRLSLRMAG
jgi:threonine dehydrogenase-like Zn-dependent dehydrogenase